MGHCRLLFGVDHIAFRGRLHGRVGGKAEREVREQGHVEFGKATSWMI